MTLLDLPALPIDPSLSLGGALVALLAAVGVMLRATARKTHAEGDAIASVVERCKALESRVGVLENALQAETELRRRVERERDEERTGKHEALTRERDAMVRLEAVERDADRRLREALRAVEQSAQERARWERLAFAAKDELERHIRASTSGQLTPGHEPEGWATQDTWPPPPEKT